MTLAPVGGRPVPPDKWHVTLVFLGSVEAAVIPCLKAAATRVRAVPFELVFDHTGYWRQARAMWMGPRPSTALDDLHAALRAGIAPCGIALEDRPFRPHLTLVRKLARSPPPTPISPVTWTVREFVLMESVAGGYARLARWEMRAVSLGRDQQTSPARG